MRCLVFMTGVLISGCGPAWLPRDAPSMPCAVIDEAAYTGAIDAGAARGRVRVNPDGSTFVDNGPGVRHCATFTAALRPCRRPNDYVLEYTPPDGEVFYVRVPANTEYRFNIRSLPNTCEILLPAEIP